jgi:hypothetical protein
MFRLNDDDIEPRVEATSQDGFEIWSRVQRISSWLRRRLGRACAAGLWTLSPDGKLGCESWRTDAEQCD